MVWLGILCSVARYIFPYTKTMNKLIFVKIRFFELSVGPSQTEKSQPIFNWLTNGTFLPEIEKKVYQHSQPLYDVMQNDIENLVFV